MNISDLLGAVMQSGMSQSSGKRLQNAVGGGSLLEGLGGLLGGQNGGGLGDLLGGKQGSGGLGDMLGGMLGKAGQAVGGKQNLAVGGLGALAGALLGGGGKSLGGALGGGVMAILGAMALKALKGSGQDADQIPAGLRQLESETDRQELEAQADLVLQAMINAAKSDGRIDDQEISRIVGKLQEIGADADDQRYVMTLMQQPMETEKLISSAKAQPALGAQVYAASLMAIEVDTPAEKAYLMKLASGLGLAPDVTRRIESMVGLPAV